MAWQPDACKNWQQNWPTMPRPATIPFSPNSGTVRRIALRAVAARWTDAAWSKDTPDGIAVHRFCGTTA